MEVQYSTGSGEPRWRSRWWLRSRTAGLVQLANGQSAVVHELYVPWWAKPLDFAHGIVFGAVVIDKV